MISVRSAVLFLLLSWVAWVLFAPYSGWYPSAVEEKVTEETLIGIRWAVLVAGSAGMKDYRHQADVCHAYHILRKGGLKRRNIIVFMYDDIAMHEDNPWRGQIYNDLSFHDVYKGVPKDYAGENVTIQNIYAVLLGKKKMTRGGSGKVLRSGPMDRVFFYYSDHGDEDVIYMPGHEEIRSQDFVDILKLMHARKSYKSMLMYVEACRGGSMFHEKLPEDINIYAVTASGLNDDSSAEFCDWVYRGILICLSNEFSHAWLSHSETNNLEEVTIGQQIDQVKNKTNSLVMEFGTMGIKNHKASIYLGNQWETGRFDVKGTSLGTKLVDWIEIPYPIRQPEVGLTLLWEMYKGTSGLQRAETLKKIRETLSERAREDMHIKMIVVLLFGSQDADPILHDRERVFPESDDLVDCIISRRRFFEWHCGRLSAYGKRHRNVFANLCKRAVKKEEFEQATIETCGFNNITWDPPQLFSFKGLM